MSPQDVGLPTDAGHAPQPLTDPGADPGAAPGADPGGDPEGVTETSPEAPDDVAGRIERVLLGRPASMGRREVSEGAGVEPVTARRFWHAMGFQVVEDEAMFTEADLEALKRVAGMISDEKVSEELAIGMTRAFARTSDRLAVWQTQLVAESLTAPHSEELEGRDSRSVPEQQVAADAAVLLATICDDIEPLLVYVWRRHLTNAIARMLADADPTVHSDPSAPIRVVGFADLVSFTSFVRRMSERQLGRVVQRFELLASDVITEHGGRVIKTVGDEVLFVHTEAAAASAIALDLVDAMAEDDLLPPVRVGLAHGRVVSRLGDVFGLTVNKASRITAVTPSGHVYVDDDMARVLGEVSGFSAIERGRRVLRGIGLVTLHELQRAPGGRRPAPSGASA
jgi:adenylate cyclase